MASVNRIICILYISCCIYSTIAWGPMRPFQYSFHHPPVLTRPKPKPEVITTTVPTTPDTPEPDTETEEITPSTYYDNAYDYNYNYNDYTNYNSFGGYNTYGGAGNTAASQHAVSGWNGANHAQYATTRMPVNPITTTPAQTEAQEVEDNQTQVTHGQCFCTASSTCPSGSIPRAGSCSSLFSYFIKTNFSRCCYRPSMVKSMPIQD